MLSYSWNSSSSFFKRDSNSLAASHTDQSWLTGSSSDLSKEGLLHTWIENTAHCHLMCLNYQQFQSIQRPRTVSNYLLCPQFAFGYRWSHTAVQWQDMMSFFPGILPWSRYQLTKFLLTATSLLYPRAKSPVTTSINNRSLSKRLCCYSCHTLKISVCSLRSIPCKSGCVLRQTSVGTGKQTHVHFTPSPLDSTPKDHIVFSQTSHFQMCLRFDKP